MKRLSSPVSEGSKKPRTSLPDVSGCLQEIEDALGRFAVLKAATRSVTGEEMQEVVSILQQWNVLEQFQPQLASLMPEFYCILKLIAQRTPTKESIADRLPYIIVSTVLIGSPTDGSEAEPDLP